MYFYINSLPLIVSINGWKHWNILNSSICVNEKTNQTIIQPGLITFNFHDYNETRVYQIPKCLFGYTFVSNLFDSVNFDESFDQYKHRITRFFNPSTEKAVKIYAQKFQTNIKPVSHTKTITVSFLPLFYEKDVYFANVSEIRKLYYNQYICTLSNGLTDYLFPITERCVMRHYNYLNTVFMLALTPSFFIISVETGMDDVVFIFGNVSRIFFKAPFRKSSFIYRQTVSDDLLLITKKTTIERFYPFLKIDFLDDIWKQNYDISFLIAKFNKLATVYIMEGFCGKPVNKDTFHLMFLFGLTHFLYSTRGDGLLPLLEILNTHQSIITMGRFLEKCFKMTKSHLLYPEMEKLQNFQLVDYSYITSDLTIPISAKLAFLSLADGRIVTVPQNKWKEIENNIETLYEKHKLFTNLTQPERANLFLLSEIGNSLVFQEKIKRKIHVLLASLCNPLEMYFWTHMLDNVMDIETMFSPCATATRKDLTQRVVNNILSYKNLDAYTNKVMNTLSVYRKKRLDMFKSISCVSNEQAAFLTLPNITYTISSKYILAGTSFSVTSTVISATIIFTVVPLNSTCTPTNYKYSVKNIKPIYNISSHDCVFCESLVVEYDDIDGIIQFVYIMDDKQLLKLIDPYTNFIDVNPRTHYLLFLRNGSVFEITALDLKSSQVSIMLVLLYLIIIIIVLFGIYHVFRLF